MEKATIERINCDDLVNFLETENVHEDVVSAFIKNRICGRVFLNLSNEELKELIPVIGDRVSVRGIIEKICKASTSPTSAMEANMSVPPVTNNEPMPSTPSTGVDTNTCSTSTSQPSNWHLGFKIPELDTFSGVVQQAIKTGVITGIARREIIQVVRMHILVHTVQPTSEQYITVCQKLIGKYPNLQDTEGSSHFGSWRLSLRNSFKNFRKKSKGLSKGREPPSKQRKVDLEDGSDIDDEVYEEALSNLKAEMKKEGKSKATGKHTTIKHIMQITRKRRCQWIQEEHPLISEVVEKFPCLAFSRWVRREFKEIMELDCKADALMDSWSDWCARLCEYSKVESEHRPLVKKIIQRLEEDSSDVACPEDYQNAIYLELLSRLLYPRGFGKNIYYVKNFQTCDVDLEAEVSQIEQAAPFIVITGIPGDETTQFFICAEKEVVMESKTLRDAIIDLISYYFIFDISYPKFVNSVHLFFQHYVFKLTDKQPVPPILSKLIGNLKKF